MAWHDPEVLIPAAVAWNGVFFALVKYLFDRAIKTIDLRLESISDIDRRVIQLETEMNLRPQCSQHVEHLVTVKDIYGRMDKMGATLAKVDGRLDGINRAVDLMNQFLIEQGGSKR